MIIRSLPIVASTLVGIPFLTAQPSDDTQLKQVIIFGRHSVRAPLVPDASLDSADTVN